MRLWIPRVPLRRHRHAAGRAVRDVVAALLDGVRPRRRPGAAAAGQPAAPDAPVVAPLSIASGSHESWSRLHSGLAAGG